jgi:hypothetical protein
MRILFLLTTLLIFFSCREDNKGEPVIEHETEEDVNENDNERYEAVKVDWSNPVLIGGSSFGNIININYKLGKFDELYRLTNSSLKSSMSKQEIVNTYRKLPMGFDLDFPMNKTEDSGVIWLHYAVEINATKKVMRMPVVVENDTCRLMLQLFKNELTQITSN